MTFAQPFADYEILDRVGAGAMGTVFKARHKRLNRIVALKVLKPSLARDARYVDRLKREARIVASLNHPNIVTGFDLGEEGGYHYFVMEFVEGKSLRAMLTEWGMFAEEYVRRVARAVAQALDHAYQRGVIHRDIKPGNILIDEAGHVKLTDMGLAKGPTDLTITRDGATVGTPQYISPEQARNPHDVDVRTDLYSLGATLYHMATGVPPFRGDTMAELITNVLHELPVSPKAINSALSDGMSLVIRKLLAKDLTVRYQTPRDLLDDLDRLDRSLPPQIDAQRLSEEEREHGRWWLRALIGAGVAALLGVAWWIGVQMRDPGPALPSAGEFLAALDQKLAGFGTIGERTAHLRAVATEPLPVGSEGEIAKRQSALDGELQRAVDGVAATFTGEGWPAFDAWLRDPSVWPDRARAWRERVQPRLFAATGLLEEQLPGSVRRARLEELQQAITRALTERDKDVVVRFEQYLQSKVATSAEQCVRTDDFATAESIWKVALDRFCNGVDMPTQAHLPEETLLLLKERRRGAEDDAVRNVLDPEETRVESALRAEVAAVCASISQQLQDDLAPESAQALLQRFRRDLLQAWPPAKSFRPGRSPWRDLERQFAGLEVEIEAAAVRQQDARFAGRCDRAWRTFCHGRAQDALAVFADEEPGAPQADAAAHHRQALAAAAAVEQALLQAVSKSPQRVLGFLRLGSVDVLELHAESQRGVWQLTGVALNPDVPARSVQLSELRFTDLLARLQKDGDPLAALAPDQRALGITVCRLAGDDLAGLDAALRELAAADRKFVQEEIWPRILRVREERQESPLDRAGLFKQLTDAREAARKSGRAGSLGELEKLLAQCSNAAPANERSELEVRELRATKSFVDLAQKQARIATEFARSAPRGSDVDVRIVDDEIVAEIAMSAAVLRGAADNWKLEGRVLEFADGGRAWSDMDKQSLRCATGLGHAAPRTTIVVDFVLPPSAVGRRMWVFEVCGIACVLVLSANDVPHAALIDGDLRREENVHRAFVHAMQEVLDPAKERRDVVVPGGVHRLTIELVTTSSRARVRVLFERTELIPPTPRQFDSERLPEFALHPQQDIKVQRVLVRAAGL
jgi:tRNA A-37 threonylcarbamoyl transferase component Bud32